MAGLAESQRLTFVQRCALCVYRLATWALQPWVVRRMRQRAVQEPLYGQGIEERFGQGKRLFESTDTRPIWIHAVSLGETRAATQLIAELSINAMTYGQYGQILLTHGTATGRAAGAQWIASHGAGLGLQVAQSWQPWDDTGSVQRFLALHQPQALWLMETEVWPNLLACCKAANLPVSLVNARMSEKTQAQSQRLAWLAHPAYAALHQVLAQTDADAQRLQAVGARVQAVTGNIKFDAAPRPELVQLGHAWASASANRPLVMLASSREGEELLFLKEYCQAVIVFIESVAIKRNASLARLLIVPRHPQRFDEVAALVTSMGVSLSRRSEWVGSVPGDTALEADVWLGDSLGEMTAYASAARVALLGGSFAPLGGQNLIELLACGCPVVMGQHTFNFAEAAERAEAAGVALRATDSATAWSLAMQLMDSADRRHGATQFVAANTGALSRSVKALTHSTQISH